MPTTEELVERYNEFSIYEIIDAYQSRQDYSAEGKSAIDIVIRNKGGLDHLRGLLEKERLIESERERLHKEVYELLINNDYDSSFINSVEAEHLRKAEIQQVIDETINEYESEVKDTEIKPRTFIGGLVGGFIAGTVSGTVWGLQMIFSGMMYYLLGLGLAVFCYSSVKFFTKQSYNNVVVLISTIASCIYAFFLGELLYFVFGYRGP